MANRDIELSVAPEASGILLVDGEEHGRKVLAAGAEGGRRGLPAVAVTAPATPGDRRKALAEGFDVHIPKPVNPDEVSVAIAELLRARPRPGRSSAGVP